MVKRDSSLQRTRFHCSRVQWRQSLYHSNRRLALLMVILGLCAAARPWKTISWSSWRAVLVLTLVVLFCELVLLTTLRLSRCCSQTFRLRNNSTYSIWQIKFDLFLLPCFLVYLGMIHVFYIHLCILTESPSHTCLSGLKLPAFYPTSSGRSETHLWSAWTRSPKPSALSVNSVSIYTYTHSHVMTHTVNLEGMTHSQHTQHGTH